MLLSHADHAPKINASGPKDLLSCRGGPQTIVLAALTMLHDLLWQPVPSRVRNVNPVVGVRGLLAAGVDADHGAGELPQSFSR